MHVDKRLVTYAANLVHYLATSVDEFCHGVDDGWELWLQYGKDYCRRPPTQPQRPASLPRPAMARSRVRQPGRVRRSDAIGSALS